MNKGQSNHISFQVAPDRMPSPSGNGDQERLRQ